MTASSRRRPLCINLFIHQEANELANFDIPSVYDDENNVAESRRAEAIVHDELRCTRSYVQHLMYRAHG